MRTHVLLTAAVVPQSSYRLALLDPTVRRAQYVDALSRWIVWAENSGGRLTLVENSGADLQLIAHEAGATSATPLTLLSVPHPPEDAVTRGKGASEALMMDAFVEATDPEADEVWVKVTGRLFVRNLDKIMPTIEGDASIARLSVALDHVDMRIIGGTPLVWHAYLAGMSNSINEADDVRIEHIAATRVLRALADGFPLRRFTGQPAVVGVSGTWASRNYGGPGKAVRRLVAGQIDRILRTSLSVKHY